MAAAFRSVSCLVCNQRKSDDTFDRHFEFTLSLRDTTFVSADKSIAFYCNLTRKQVGGPSSRNTEIPAVPRRTHHLLPLLPQIRRRRLHSHGTHRPRLNVRATPLRRGSLLSLPPHAQTTRRPKRNLPLLLQQIH